MKIYIQLPQTLLFGLFLLFFVSVQSCGSGELKGQENKDSEVFTVAFYNVENLFDVFDDPVTKDDDFLPTGSYGWTEEYYQVKLANLARAIAEMGDENGPEILGFAEVENRKVIEDLIQMPGLLEKNYGIVHHDSPDDRGIDVALIYKKDHFTPETDQVFSIPFPEDKELHTRDILLVSGKTSDDEQLSVLVNHWSSRRGGPEASNFKRERAAGVARQIVDSLFVLNENSNVMLIGDFNDEPFNSSLTGVLRAGKDPENSLETGLYNPMFNLKGSGEKVGSLRYKEFWNLFDQVVLSKAMVTDQKGLNYVEGSAAIYNPEWMRVPEGFYKDAPKRSYISKKFYPDGFSDHFPVYVHLKRF